ncbi:MAG: DUF1501 domain-containing protein, partial [Verrucomicrobiota bacterium]
METSRREFLTRCGMGMGALALGSVVDADGSSFEVKKPHFVPKAKRVIHLFMNGGPSHVDTFDPKPELTRLHDKPLPMDYLKTERKTGNAFKSPFSFAPRGQSGLPVSEIFKEVGSCIDDICVIRSMHADVPNHEPSLMLMNCGMALSIRPSLGSWITYGLGSENQNLPGFITMCPNGYPIQESQNWQSGFLPGIYQGTYLNTKHTEVDKLIEHIAHKHTSRTAQRRQLDLLLKMNQKKTSMYPRKTS